MFAFTNVLWVLVTSFVVFRNKYEPSEIPSTNMTDLRCESREGYEKKRRQEPIYMYEQPIMYEHESYSSDKDNNVCVK